MNWNIRLGLQKHKEYRWDKYVLQKNILQSEYLKNDFFYGENNIGMGMHKITANCLKEEIMQKFFFAYMVYLISSWLINFLLH